MAVTPGTIRSGVGFRHVQVLLLNEDDYPAATSTVAYAGAQISGVRAMTIDDPEPRDIVHIGDDSVFQRDVLPPDTPISGELRTGKVNDTVDDIITDDIVTEIGDMSFFGFGTDNRGDENQVAVLAYRQTLDTNPGSSDFGKRRWEGRLYPKLYLIPRESGFEDTPEERAYTLRPLFCTKHLWGVAFSGDVEGFTRAQGLRLISEYKPKIVGFMGNAADVAFLFPTAYPAQNADKVTTWVLGVETAAGECTATSVGITFSSANVPTATDYIVVLYEYE